jgi:heme/copper-type cytochrome/quinol oxidase subunit 3
MMKQRITLDVGELPQHGLETASRTLWGTLAFELIEGTGFALAIATYLYLYSLAPAWPIRAQLPDLGPGTGLTLLLLVSLIPNYFIGKWAKEGRVGKVRIGILAMSVLGAAPLILRAYEFPAMHISWDANAYGSIVWLLLGLHTTHLITDLGDTLVLAALMFTRHAHNRRRLGDVQDNAVYWNFVVAAWLPIYGVIYWIPRL